MSVTAKFNFVTQFSERFLNRLVKELYALKAFPVEYDGTTSETLALYGLTVTISYKMALAEPTLYLNTNVDNGAGLRGSVTGHLQMVAHLDPMQGEANAPDYLVPIDVNASFDAVLQLQFVTAGDNVYLQLHLADLPDLEFTLDPNPVPSVYQTLVQQVLKRVLLVAFRTKVVKVPVSVLMQAALLGGWAAEPPVLRVMPASATPGLGSATVAFNTYPNRGLGVAGDLVDWTNPGYEFGIALDQNFILQLIERAWQRQQIPTRFNDRGQPDASGGNVLTSVTMNFEETKITVSLQASLAGSAFWVHGSARPSMVGTAIHVDVFDVQVEFPIWIDIVGIVLLNIFWTIIDQALSNFLGGLIGQAAQQGINQFLANHQVRLSFSGTIPGTNLVLTAQPDIINVTADDINSGGHVAFTTS